MENQAVFYISSLDCIPFINEMISLEKQGHKASLTTEDCIKGDTHYLCYIVKWR